MNPKEINNIYKNIYTNWDEKYFYELLDRFKLSDDKKYSALSKGMKVKLKIAIAMAIRPEILILDEPTSGLDPVIRSEILDLFLEFMEDENHSILISSHITSDLEKIADYITFIDDGKLIFTEEKYELYENYGILRCDKEHFKNIDKNYIVKYKEDKYQINALITNVSAFKKTYPNLTVDGGDIDEIMVLYLRGEKL